MWFQNAKHKDKILKVSQEKKSDYLKKFSSQLKSVIMDTSWQQKNIINTLKEKKLLTWVLYPAKLTHVGGEDKDLHF